MQEKKEQVKDATTEKITLVALEFTPEEVETLLKALELLGCVNGSKVVKRSCVEIYCRLVKERNRVRGVVN